jgi:hypothetical protein
MALGAQAQNVKAPAALTETILTPVTFANAI